MTVSDVSPKAPKVIKRYSNRKLYDTVESRYVTLDEIAEMIKTGVEVKIVDNQTKEDLTSVTLAQIVFEEEKKKSTVSLATLREMIRSPQLSLSELTAQVSQRVASIREEAGQRLNTLLGREGDEAASPAATLIQQSQKAVENWQQRVDERVKSAVDNVIATFPSLSKDTSTFDQRLEAIEKRLAALEQSTKR
jgi:polyhydroxyalkanoate synthesis repressor PhaR